MATGETRPRSLGRRQESDIANIWGGIIGSELADP